jgi:hypothetical protein
MIGGNPTKRQTMVNKALHIKLKIGQHESQQNRRRGEFRRYG